MTANLPGLMEILICNHDVNNPGGIINATEDLILGFQELGHHVDMVDMVWTEQASGKTTRFPERYIQGVLYPINQEHGWLWPDGKRIPYKGKENIERWKEFASRFDVLVWQPPVPTMRKSNKGNLDWLELYELPDDVRQIAIVHDAHFPKRYPYLWFVGPTLDGLVAVNFSAYHSLKIDIPKIAAMSPRYVPDEFEWIRWQDRRKGFLSVQIWKRWKHVDDIVRAVPWMDEDVAKVMAGEGIERYYMCSEDKCKDIYYNEQGRRIWDVAEEHGMEYLGTIHPDERDELLADLRTLIDPSWSKSFAKYGGHHNRTVIEAIVQGAIPIARNLGIADNEEGESDLFHPGENYVMIPWDATPQEFAEIVNEANNMTSTEAARYQDAGLDMLDHFDRRVVAQQYLSVALGEGTGFYERAEVVETPQSIIDAAEKKIVYFEDGT